MVLLINPSKAIQARFNSLASQFSMYGRKRRVVEELRELSFQAIGSFIDEISYE